MSADLFAEFEGKSSTSKPTARPVSLPSNSLSFGATVPAKPTVTSGQQVTKQSNQWFSHRQTSSAADWTTSSKAIQPQSARPEDNDDDDGWGDFEVAPSTTQNDSVSQGAIPADPIFPRDRIVRASTVDLMSNNMFNLPASSTPSEEIRKPSWAQNPAGQLANYPPQATPQKKSTKAPISNADVLFDADDFDDQQPEDDEDFGDFETVQTPPDLLSQDSSTSPAPAVQSASQMLSGLTLTEPSSPYPQAPRSPSFHDRNPFPGLALTTPPQEAGKKVEGNPKTTPLTAWSSVANASAGSNANGDDWGSFEDFHDGIKQSDSNPPDSNWNWDPVEPAKQPSTELTQSPTKAISSGLDSSWDWDSVDANTEKGAEALKEDLPPINVPPPSVLLSIFPHIFSQANSSLYKPVSGQSFSIKNRILSDPKTVEFLKGYVSLATVAARIIAGRKLRWHRDKFLSQGMSISAAGSKGMKLAGIDKAQAAREDREATDVVDIWKEQVGRLRAAIAATNSSIKNSAEHLKIPEIREPLPVQTAKGVPTAPKACLICGLRRDERIPKVDYEVEDSFGEWWTDHWGHLACKRFWLQHEATLRQR